MRRSEGVLVREIFSALAAVSNINVVIVSGREHQSLGKFFEGMPVHLVAEHGLSYRKAGSLQWQHLFPDLDLSWRDAVMPVLNDYVLRSPGFGDWQVRELATHLSSAFAKSPLDRRVARQQSDRGVTARRQQRARCSPRHAAVG